MMKDFIQITKDDVLPRLMNNEEVYAFTLIIGKNGSVTHGSKKLKNETIDNISKTISSNNVILFVRKAVSNS